MIRCPHFCKNVAVWWSWKGKTHGGSDADPSSHARSPVEHLGVGERDASATDRRLPLAALVVRVLVRSLVVRNCRVPAIGILPLLTGIRASCAERKSSLSAGSSSSAAFCARSTEPQKSPPQRPDLVPAFSHHFFRSCQKWRGSVSLGLWYRCGLPLPLRSVVFTPALEENDREFRTLLSRRIWSLFRSWDNCELLLTSEVNDSRLVRGKVPSEGEFGEFLKTGFAPLCEIKRIYSGLAFLTSDNSTLPQSCSGIKKPLVSPVVLQPPRLDVTNAHALD